MSREKVFVTCPECTNEVEVRIPPLHGPQRVPRTKAHYKETRTWTRAHANGFHSGVIVRVRCFGSNAMVVFESGLDRRNA